MISKKEVEHIAELARLELTDLEVEKMQKDLTEILDYFNLLKKAPKPGKFNQIKGDLSSLRKDETEIRDASAVEKLITALPDKKENYIKVKTIL